MRRGATIAAILVACALAIPTGLAAAATTKLSVRIEGRTGTLFEGPILTEGHAVHSYKGAGGSEAEDERMKRSGLAWMISRLLLARDRIAWCIVGTPVYQVGCACPIQPKNLSALQPVV